MGYNRLALSYVYGSVAVLHPQHTIENYSVFVELGRLARLLPAAWTAHVGDAGILRTGVDPSDIFVDTFRLISSRFNTNRLPDESGHLVILHVLQKHLLQDAERVYTYIFAETLL